MRVSGKRQALTSNSRFVDNCRDAQRFASCYISGMPIRRETRWLYLIDWPLISKHIRFEVAGPHGAGRCWKCGRPHGQELRVLPDGRWFDAEQHTWRDARGKEAAWPDMVDACRMRKTRVILAACHRDHATGILGGPVAGDHRDRVIPASGTADSLMGIPKAGNP
ncbi:hypothetical protein [Azospirillum argentinense]|uniref:Uncharacterized protein n=1 Tax=Azospirillum brasilense TaxID=192 RepID=A0A4D8QB61_AZOBR|nr:hypothetical protein [Azospirillum argentinense]QCO03392.1 hypothetical protein D3867_15040 [Azospirillum argentinense]